MPMALPGIKPQKALRKEHHFYITDKMQSAGASGPPPIDHNPVTSGGCWQLSPLEDWLSPQGVFSLYVLKAVWPLMI